MPVNWNGDFRSCPAASYTSSHHRVHAWQAHTGLGRRQSWFQSAAQAEIPKSQTAQLGHEEGSAPGLCCPCLQHKMTQAPLSKLHVMEEAAGHDSFRTLSALFWQESCLQVEEIARPDISVGGAWRSLTTWTILCSSPSQEDPSISQHKGTQAPLSNLHVMETSTA